MTVFCSTISYRPTDKRDAVPDRVSIESALQRVQSGELSPAEATHLLLAGQADPPAAQAVAEGDSAGESLASLVDRLGGPPVDIVTAWCQQLREIAGQHERETGESLPAIDLNHWSITPQGRFAWHGRLRDVASVGSKPTQASLNRIDQFRTTLIPDVADDIIPAVLPATVVRPSKGRSVGHRPNKDEDRTKDDERKDRAWIGPHARQLLFVTAVLGCVGAGGSILYQSSLPVKESAARNDTPATFSADFGSRTSGAVGEMSSGEPTAAVLDELDGQALESLESMTEAELSALENEIETSDALSLDALMPPAASFVPSGYATSANSSTSADPTQVTDQTNAGGANQASRVKPAEDDKSGGVVVDLESSEAGTVAEVFGDEDQAPVESPQQTRASTVMAVQLRPVDDATTTTKLADRPMNGLSLDFPFEVPLQIEGEESPWEVHDTRKKLAIAVISSGPQLTELKWTDDASRSSAVQALVHGRITNRSGDTVFLRPQIEADPWPIRVDRPDVMPTWDLRQPIPPRVARLSIDFDLPNNIEQGWIEPVAAESLRRTRGLVVLTPKDGESVALGIRLDIRCSRKLSCRVRYAGRLDASMPWQIVSVPLLEQFANQLTQQAILVSREADRLARVYEIAGSSGRRILRVKQNRNDALAESIGTASQRVAKLQTLIATIESEAALKVRVWVEWPDSEQTLLTTHSSEASGS